MEVGMYIRINGFISKIEHIHTSQKGQTYMQFEEPSGILASINTCLYEGKASFNIEDLLQDGDYANGEMVMDADWYDQDGNYDEGLAFPLYNGEDKDVIIGWQPLKYTKIKSVVTHEQFDDMKYEVK